MMRPPAKPPKAAHPPMVIETARPMTNAQRVSWSLAIGLVFGFPMGLAVPHFYGPPKLIECQEALTEAARARDALARSCDDQTRHWAHIETERDACLATKGAP